MSLTMSLFNHHGIVMSADKMIISTYRENNNQLQTINMPPTEQKLFLIEDKYGLSYTGDSSINSVPLSALLENYFQSNPILSIINAQKIGLPILQAILSLNFPKTKI